MAITESLGRSALVKRGSEGMSVREATIIVALVNHPALIDENFEHVEFLDLANSDLQAAACAPCSTRWRMTWPMTATR